MRQQFFEFYSNNTQLSIEAKFARFQQFCKYYDLRTFPAHPFSIYRYVHFFRDEGQTFLHSFLKYLATISLVHQSRGSLGFSAFNGATRRLTLAWLQVVPTRPSFTSQLAVAVFFRILELGLSTFDIRTLKACTSATFDLLFFIGQFWTTCCF